MEHMDTNQHGPLTGLRVVEFASIGPGPHCAMLLADMGADIVRIDRPGGNGWPNPIVDRGRAVLTMDIRSEEGRTRCLEACDLADVVIEGSRPGVMERLGLGPDVLLSRNPRLIYGRMTGWGQTGPMARTAGHDINYIALAGALAPIGEGGGRSVPPLNLVGDFGGGSMFLLFGIMAALYERERSGLGQVVDAAIIDGVSNLMTMFTGLMSSGRISLDRDRNILGGAAPFYRTYRCSDGREMAVGAIEPQFWRELLRLLGIGPHEQGISQNECDWPRTIALFEARFSEKTSAEWTLIFAGTDACVVPVLSVEESRHNDHFRAREVYLTAEGLPQAAPAPRLSRTPGMFRSKRDGVEQIKQWAEQSYQRDPSA